MGWEEREKRELIVVVVVLVLVGIFRVQPLVQDHSERPEGVGKVREGSV